ncbi:uncharacterized protein LOC128985619 isoform X2 [Macrosteles quadrilineatus]|uniref:uncharacterized protein LOC128985619 isoform X2 n=1 Tax=Macrosteles quadrilineatus TaxID=74068 RepID=UPI0023E2203F|nr:uncharacterized protein LOC128985619 isoform X2 [Macrosteles quadrilineatus]
MLSSLTLVLPLLLLTAGCVAFQCSTSPFSQQTTEYLVCPNEDYKTYNDPEFTNDCDYLSTLPFNLCDGSELQSLVLCWKLQDPVSGTMQVTYPLLPQRCNYTGYDLTLMVHEASNCPSNTEDFYKHSKREVSIRNCMDTSCHDQCTQRGVVEFRHMFTACYQLFVTPKRHLKAYQDLVSSAVAVTMQYVKTPINTMHSPIFHLEWNSASVTMQANYPFVPSSSHISISYGIDTSIGHNACRNTGISLASCVTCLGSPDIKCKTGKGETVAPTCSYQGDSVVRCRFSSLKPGNYCVRIQFDDDRCAADSVWSEYNNYSTCTWEVFQQFLSPEQQAVEVIEDTKISPTINPIMLIFIAFAIIACVVVALVVYQHLMPGAPHFLPVQHKNLQVSERPVVLLLYVRDCTPFMQAVEHLRTLMRRVYNCQVIDCWEDSQFGAVAQNPARWLMSHLSSSRVRCVLVTSPASVVQEAALVHGQSVRYRQPKALDALAAHALATLHETSGHDSYNRLFVVRLDPVNHGEGTFPQVRTYLNPLTTYVLPTHLNRLMATLYNLDSSVCTIATDGTSDEAMLSEIIDEYREYLRENPRYLDSLLVSDSHQSVLHILN